MFLLLLLEIINLKFDREKINIPAIQGRPISIVISSEKEILFVTVMLSPLVFAEVIPGTRAVANAILNDNGNVVKVSIFPLKIPYCFKAWLSVRNFCKPLFTVVESIFLLIEPKIELIDIGIETDKTLFTVFRIPLLG